MTTVHTMDCAVIPLLCHLPIYNKTNPAGTYLHRLFSGNTEGLMQREKFLLQHIYEGVCGEFPERVVYLLWRVGFFEIYFYYL